MGIDENGTLQSYDYNQGRLTFADTLTGRYKYNYDKVGNRTLKVHTDKNGGVNAQSYSYPQQTAGNRLLSKTENTLDQQSQQFADGDTKSLKYNKSGSPETSNDFSYEYNANQRPIKVYKQTQEGNSTNKELLAEYRYNSFGERIKKVSYSQGKKAKVTYFLYEGHTLTTEIEKGPKSGGVSFNQYIYLNHQPIVKLEDKQLYAIHSDHLGTPRAASNDNKETVWKANYTPFGKAELETNRVTINLRLLGQYEDQETGTHYNYFRDYDPETARYITSDPIGLKGGVNTYAYVNGNPIHAVDTLGLDIEILIGGPYPGSSYGHVALRVFGDGYDNTYDYGRYGETYGVSGSEGEGMLRVWTDFNRYITGEIVTGRTTEGFVYNSSQETDQSIIKHYEDIINGITPNIERGDYMKQYKIDDYNAANSNCTTVTLDALQASLTSELFSSINNLEFEGTQDLGFIFNKLFNNAKDEQEILRLPFDLRAAILDSEKYDEKKTYKRNSNVTPFPD